MDDVVRLALTPPCEATDNGDGTYTHTFRAPDAPLPTFVADPFPRLTGAKAEEILAAIREVMGDDAERP